MSDVPEDLRELHRKLESVRFRPRPSFEPELLGRVRRGHGPLPAPPSRTRRQLIAAAAAILIAGAAAGLARLGAGLWEDVLVLAERDDRVRRLRIYEDLDGSRTFTPGDVVRLDRGVRPAMLSAGGDEIVTTERCCLDFDGGGPDDDGLLVIGVPPDRILMAAIYETGAKARPPSGWPLR